MADLQRYPIRAVARMTGLSVDTLRAWERRYEAVVPSRGERGRLYTEHHVERLKQLAALVERGHAIGTIASLSEAALKRLSAAEPVAAAVSPAAPIDPLRRAISRYDLDGIDAFLSRHAVMLAPHDFIFGIILPALRDVGARWEAGAVCPAQEHLFSGVVRGVLGGLLRAMPRALPRHRSRPTVFATPSGDRHELGLLCGAVLAAWAGHAVTYLGPDLPADDLLHAVKSSKAARLVLAATTADGVDVDDVKRLRRMPDAVTICAGGPEAAVIRQAVGARVQTFASLENLYEWLGRDAH